MTKFHKTLKPTLKSVWLFSHRDKELPQTWRRVSNNSISNSNKKLVIKHNSREISKMHFKLYWKIFWNSRLLPLYWSYLVLVFLLLTLNMYLPPGNYDHSQKIFTCSKSTNNESSRKDVWNIFKLAINTPLWTDADLGLLQDPRWSSLW